MLLLPMATRNSGRFQRLICMVVRVIFDVVGADRDGSSQGTQK